MSNLEHPPPTPSLTLLYTAYVIALLQLNIGPGPRGNRLEIPIVEENFTQILISFSLTPQKPNI
jgi:hypothetical protein